MIRASLWLFSGVLLGLMIHLIVILILPSYASKDVWSRLSALDAKARIRVLDPVALGAPNPLRLDPELVYAVCQLDLSEGPGVVTGTLPGTFWSLGVFDSSGVSIYSTTNRAGVGDTVDLGIFNSEQTHLLAEQQFTIEEGLLIVQAPTDDLFVVVRLAPPYPQLKARYAKALMGLECSNIPSAPISGK